MNSNPPFAIEQKIICIKNSEGGHIVKGIIYTCAGCYKCSYCGKWRVAIKECPCPYDTGNCSNECSSPIIRNGFYYLTCFSSYFAPIEDQYENITAEIAQSATQTEERPDRISIPETVNN